MSGTLSFGYEGDEGLVDRLLAAVLRGAKTATSSLAVEYLSGEPLPRVGERLTLVDHAGRAHGVVETTRVAVIPLHLVKDDVARDEGEGFADAAAWRDAHMAFWNEVGDLGRADAGDPGWELRESEAVVVQWFRLLLTSSPTRVAASRPRGLGVLDALNFPVPPLATDRVLLRSWQARDADEVFTAFSDPQTLRFSWPREEAYTLADAREFLVQQERGRCLGDEIQWAAVEPRTGTLLGCASLYDVELDAGRASIGYWVAAPARGRGVATACVQLVAGWAFSVLGLTRLQLTCSPDNHASQAVAARCGFVREGLLRSHLPFKGGRRDTVVFSRLSGPTKHL